MSALKPKIVIFLILEFFWIVWNNSWDVTIWLYGLLIVVPAAALFGGAGNIFKGVRMTPKGILYSLLYVWFFLVALVRSNLDVIYRVLHPKLPVRPGIVRVETKLTSPMARMILANSITLTPGTFVVDIKDNLIYVHWIDVCCEGSPSELVQRISGRFENLLTRIYE